MGLVRLTKSEVAEKQLAKAIELFCGQEPLPAITLAGAAEEILGKLVKDGGGASAIEEEVKDRCDLYQTVFGHFSDPKVFADLMNNPKNELKHRMSGNPLELNLEKEAVNLIQRAIDNFQRLRPGLMQCSSDLEMRRRPGTADSVNKSYNNALQPTSPPPPLSLFVRHRDVRHLVDSDCDVRSL